MAGGIARFGKKMQSEPRVLCLPAGGQLERGEMGCNWGWVANGSRCGVMLTGDTLSGISPRTKEADAKQ